jgi:phage host-nuclease inhibitor protein Gam
MEKQKVIDLIAGRIIDEYRKHQLLEWNKIAAAKIYSQWFDFLNEQITEMEKEIKSLKERVIFWNEAHNDLINKNPLSTTEA